ncbi:AsmA family protein [Marivirga sp. S37H4]|uniref:AsmA family protein n=1 Tax=Marivirga aurantiaca TaxID=2802615 RepID=A0A934WXQ1_9BACT|nr:AsmA-like C-terminal region-containing protein [Marivirga aurantiaca]MBK6265083.1 AsmA family protein [Marivirga aurantiaca]
MKRIKKFFIYTFFIFITVFASVSTYLYFNQDKLVNQIIVTINKNLQTPIEVTKIDLNWWTDFPNISLRFQNVTIQESIKGSKFPLAKLEQLSLSFDLISLYKQNYQFDKIILKNGEVTIRTTKEGITNYQILKESSDSSEENQQFNFNIKDINIDNVAINYVDHSINQSYLLVGHKVSAQLVKKKDVYKITAKGDLTSKAIKIDEFSYFENKKLKLDASLDYNEAEKKVIIKPSKVLVASNNFEISGVYQLEDSYMNLNIAGIDTDFNTLLSLLPEQYSKPLSAYQSTGEADFKGTIIGKLTRKENPAVNLEFNVQEASLFHPEYKTRISHLNLNGQFSNGKYQSFETSRLALNNMAGVIQDKPFTADLTLSNFNNYFLTLSTEGVLSTQDLFTFLPNKDKMKDLAGEIEFNIKLSGYIDDFKKASTAHKISNSGEILLKNVGGIYLDYPLPLKNISGRLLFNKNDIAINSLSGIIGESDITMNGFFLNIFPYLLQENQSLLVEASTKSRNINLNELLSGLSNEENTLEKQEKSFKFSISPYLRFDLETKVSQLTFKRFSARNISGKINVLHQELKAQNLNLKSSGGEMVLNGTINTVAEDQVKINTVASFKKINIDSIFYSFDNFNQDFLADRHLKGKIDAKVSAFILLDKSLNFKPEDFTADINATIINGQLNNFAPMLSLSDYVNEKELSNLSFGELTNTIRIENKTIYLPEMVIKSNISEIVLQGTHTFDQQINYRLLVPLKNFKKQDKDEAFGAIEKTDDYTKLHLKIVGTTDDFKVNWDGQRSLKSVAERIQEEGKTIKKIISGEKPQEKKKKEVELNEDEYFDW